MLGKGRHLYSFWLENPRSIDKYWDTDVNRRTILKLLVEKLAMKMRKAPKQLRMWSN